MPDIVGRMKAAPKIRSLTVAIPIIGYHMSPKGELSGLLVRFVLEWS